MFLGKGVDEIESQSDVKTVRLYLVFQVGAGDRFKEPGRCSGLKRIAACRVENQQVIRRRAAEATDDVTRQLLQELCEFNRLERKSARDGRLPHLFEYQTPDAQLSDTLDILVLQKIDG